MGDEQGHCEGGREDRRAVRVGVRRLGKKEFSLRDLYAFEEELRELHPKNKHIRPKIRQQLQVLRDRGGF